MITMRRLLFGNIGYVRIISGRGAKFTSPLKNERDYLRALSYLDNCQDTHRGHIKITMTNGGYFKTAISSGKDLERAKEFLKREFEILYNTHEILSFPANTSKRLSGFTDLDDFCDVSF